MMLVLSVLTTNAAHAQTSEVTSLGNLEELGTQREAAQAELAKQKKLVKLYYQVFCTPQRWKAQEAVRTEEKKIADLDKRIEEAKKSSPEPENSSSSEPADNQV